MRHSAKIASLSIFTLLTTSGFLAGQAPPSSSSKPPAQKPSPTKPDAATLPKNAPASQHYPILVIARGNEPSWNMRIGMKGPERLDRMGYPPIELEPHEIQREEAGNAWNYHAKDVATGADVVLHLTRETCADSMADTKYTFKAVVEHSQIGTLRGCAQSSPDKFPEFKLKNQPEPDDPNDPNKKKTVFDPITNAVPPVAIAYLDTAGRVIFSRGEIKKTVAPAGQELALSHNGKRLVYTRSDSKSGPERTLVLYDFDTGRSQDLTHGLVRAAFWSPDDSKIAFLKADGDRWQVWSMPVNDSAKAALFAATPVTSLHGWTTGETVLATDATTLYWLGSDGKVYQSIPLGEVYGGNFQIMSSDTLRANPLNSDLLLVSAYYHSAPIGAPIDTSGLNSSCFMYELKSRRQTILCPKDAFSKSAEWSRDGLQAYYSRLTPPNSYAINRIFWDGSGAKRYVPGSNLVIGQ